MVLAFAEFVREREQAYRAARLEEVLVYRTDEELLVALDELA
jgi:hypothetical protein